MHRIERRHVGRRQNLEENDWAGAFKHAHRDAQDGGLIGFDVDLDTADLPKLKLSSVSTLTSTCSPTSLKAGWSDAPDSSKTVRLVGREERKGAFAIAQRQIVDIHPCPATSWGSTLSFHVREGWTMDKRSSAWPL